MRGMTTEQGEERSRLTLVWKKETARGKVPACLPTTYGRHEEAHKSSAQQPELSRPFPLCGVAEQTAPSNPQHAF